MLLVVAIPIIIQNGVSNFVNLLDNIMIGQLGTTQMSGVSIVNQLLAVFNVTIFGAMSGPGIFTAQFFGKKDDNGIRQCVKFKYMIGSLILITGLLIFYFFGPSLISLYLRSEANQPGEALATLKAGTTYLNIMLLGLPAFVLSNIYSSLHRETGDTFQPMLASSIAVVSNTVLNFVLIFGHFGFPRLAVAGGALATVIARYIELTIIYVLTKRDTIKQSYFKSVKLDQHLVISMISRSAPLLVNEILWSITGALINQCYSLRSLNAVAALNITTTVSSLFMIICYAMGNTISILVGQQLGAGNSGEAYDTDLRIITFNVALSTLACFLLLGVKQYIPNLYNTSDEVKALAIQLLTIAAIMMPVQATYFSCYFTMRAGGKTVLTFLFDSVYSAVISFPLAYILVHYTTLDITKVYLFVLSADIIKSAFGLYLIHKGVWINNIVNNELKAS